MNRIKIQSILEKIVYTEFIGDKSIEISKIEQITYQEKIDFNSLCWSNDENLYKVYNLNKGTFIVSKNYDKDLQNINCNYILVENPRRAFQTILNLFFVEKPIAHINSTAIIHKTVKLGNSVSIGANVIIEKDCVIGDNSKIGHNTVILNNTKIGNNVVIGCNNTIGGVGFGYEKNKLGEFELIPHIGGVIIKNNVDIGNNTCIDRAVIGNTEIGTNVKVDNLVHIAHGVIIGENSVIIANVMIGGSTIIGSNVWVAPSASLINKIKIANNSLVGISANVVKDVAEYDIVAGNPAKVIRNLKNNY